MTQPTSLYWDPLLDSLEEGRIVPVIGPELSTVACDGRTLQLDQYIAERLITEFGVDVTQLPDSRSLSDVAWFVLNTLHQDRPALRARIQSVMKEPIIQPSQGLLQLTGIEKFPLFVTTNFDSLLLRALQQQNRAVPEQNVCAYSLKSAPSDLEGVNPRLPIVYHLFGRAAGSADYAVTDEDRLEFICDFQPRNKAVKFFDRLRDSDLLLIGCSFPDWLTRFFLRVLRGKRLGTDEERQETVADDRTPVDRPLVFFLKECRVQVYRGAGTASFVDELMTEWAKKRGSGGPTGSVPTVTADDTPVVTPVKAVDLPSDDSTVKEATDDSTPTTAGTGPADVFLSYASEDSEPVARLRDTLEKAGVRVWFDQRNLRPGEEYQKEIEGVIEGSAFFFPCISTNSLRPQRRRFFRWEWKQSKTEADFREEDPPYIQPIILDDTRFDDDRIPNHFRHLHMQPCPRGEPPESFVVLTQQRIKALPAQRPRK